MVEAMKYDFGVHGTTKNRWLSRLVEAHRRSVILSKDHRSKICRTIAREVPLQGMGYHKTFSYSVKPFWSSRSTSSK